MNITVRDLTGESSVLAGRPGLGREIRSPQILTPDLSALMTGREMSGRVLHLRPSLTTYLCSLDRDARMKLVRVLVKKRPACILMTGGKVAPDLLEAAGDSKIPVLRCRNLPKLTRFLMGKLTPQTSIHGVLVQIYELGTLIIGESAVGKSEAALDLVLRGHKLAADDMVILKKMDASVSGSAMEMGSNLLQIRGLGIIDVRALYGASATVDTCTVGLVVELEEWQKGHQYSLVGLRERRYRILGINLPYLKLPVKPGRNMATLIEVAARNQILKKQGIFSARDLDKKLKKRLAE